MPRDQHRHRRDQSHRETLPQSQWKIWEALGVFGMGFISFIISSYSVLRYKQLYAYQYKYVYIYIYDCTVFYI